MNSKLLIYRRYSLVFFQLILLLIIAVVWLVFSDWTSLKSAVLGGISWVIPSIYFAWKSERVKVINDSKKMLKSFLMMEITKMLLSFITIALILLTCSIQVAPFLTTYAAVILVSVVVSFSRGAEG